MVLTHCHRHYIAESGIVFGTASVTIITLAVLGPYYQAWPSIRDRMVKKCALARIHRVNVMEIE